MPERAEFSIRTESIDKAANTLASELRLLRLSARELDGSVEPKIYTELINSLETALMATNKALINSQRVDKVLESNEESRR